MTTTGEGGDAACWSHLVCDECGAVEENGHRDGCSRLDSEGDDAPDPSA
jgi:hypothetical protein